MQERNERDIVEAMIHAVEEKRLWAGRLMSPEETAQALSARVATDSRLNGWFFCGTAHPAMFRCCVTEPIHSLLVPIGTGYSIQFMIVVQQCHHWQSRMILPLVGNFVQDFLDTLVRGDALKVSLADGDDENAVVSQLMPGSCSSLPEVSTMRVQAVFDTKEVLALTSSLIDVLLRPESFRTIDSSQDVRNVCVSYVFPEDFRERIEHGAPFHLVETEFLGKGNIH